MIRAVTFLLGFIALCSTANAACRCACVNGSVQAICSSPLTIPPICPPRFCAGAPAGFKPFNNFATPPVGTQNCTQRQVQNPWTGRYEWRTICR